MEEVNIGMKNQKLSHNHVSVYGFHDGKSKRWELTINPNNPKDLEALRLAVKHPPQQRFPRYNPFPNARASDNGEVHTLDIQLES